MNKHLVWETLESYYSNSNYFHVCLFVLIMTDKKGTPSHRRSPTPINPVLLDMLKEIKDDLKSLHTTFDSIETRVGSIAGHHPNHRTRFDQHHMVRQEREDYSHSLTPSHYRQRDYIYDFNDDYDFDEGYEEWRRVRNNRRTPPPREGSSLNSWITRLEDNIEHVQHYLATPRKSPSKCKADTTTRDLLEIGRAHV